MNEKTERLIKKKDVSGWKLKWDDDEKEEKD